MVVQTPAVVDRDLFVDCPFFWFVVLAKAGIQTESFWIPCQIRNDN